MKDSIVIGVGSYKASVSVEEAVALRDSLCARLGCPTFCTSETKSETVDDKITSLVNMEVISDIAA